MKLTMLNGSLLFAGLSAIGLASISLEPLPSLLFAGDVHELSWTSDRDYYDAELLLVKRYSLPAGGGWDPIRTVFKNHTVATGSGTYNWTVPNVRDPGSYSLWLGGNDSPRTGYANLTNAFGIESPANSGRPSLSAGQIIGIAFGGVAALLVGAAAIVIMLRVTRNKPKTGSPETNEAGERNPFASDLDEEAEAREPVRDGGH